MTYEELLDEVDKEGILLLEDNRIGRLDGLYVDGTITLHPRLETTVEKKCTLIEELGHHHTTTGNILDLSDIRNRKQERNARAWGFRNAVGITKLIEAYKSGVRNRYELAEFLDVTEEYIDEVLKYYCQKYGPHFEIDNYVVFFSPLAVFEQWE